DPIVMDTVTSNDVPVRIDDPDAPPVEEWSRSGGDEPPAPPRDDGGGGLGSDEPAPTTHKQYEANDYVKDLGYITDSENSIRKYPRFIGKLLSATRINPAAAMQTRIGRLTLAYKIHQFKAKQMIGKVLHDGIDSFNARGVLNSMIGR